MTSVLAPIALVLATATCDLLTKAVAPTTKGTSAVAVSPTGATVNNTGGSFAFSATPLDASGNPLVNKSLTWATSNGQVASAENDGAATGLASGQTAISAAVDGVVGYATLTIASPSSTPVASWSSSSAVANEIYYDVQGFPGTGMYVVGTTTTGGGIIRKYDGANWVTISNPAGAFIHGLWCLADTLCYSAGSGGAAGQILKFNGSSWSVATSATQNFHSVWAATPACVYAVGIGGQVYRYNGTSWASMTSNTSSLLNSVWGTACDNVYAVGDNGTIIRYTGGASWSVLTSGTSQHLQGVWGTAGSSVYAVGYSGTVRRSVDGTSWSPIGPAGTPNFTSIWGTADAEIYAAAEGGSVMRYDGAAWSSVATGTSSNLYSVWGAQNGDVFAVGNNGVILKGTRTGGAAVATVSLSPSGATILSVGGTQQFTASILDAGGNPITGKPVTWKVSNGSVGSVNSSGLASSVSVGQVSVSATVDAVTAYATLTVAAASSTPVSAWGSAAPAAPGSAQFRASRTASTPARPRLPGVVARFAQLFGVDATPLRSPP